MTGLLIAGGRIVDPANSLDALRDLRVRDGAVIEIGEHLEPQAGEMAIDAAGTIVTPGLVDMHVHLREPGFPAKERIETGTEAALRGGFTSVACMPNTAPAIDDPAILMSLKDDIERRARCRVYPIAAITRGRRGAEPCDFAALARVGAVAFSDDGDTVKDLRVLREAALLAQALKPPFISHCEPEDETVARDLAIAGEIGKSWHIAHVTTRGALDAIRAARARGVRATCEATPHHLNCTRDAARELGPAARVNPPLRDEDDVAALRAAVRDGTIDAFASDHAPHSDREKRATEGAAPGFTGLEIAVGAYAAALPDLPMTRFIELIATNPARILGLRAGTLSIGAPADVTILADRAWTVDPATFASLGKCTPFAGSTLPRKVLATIVGGELRYRAVDLAA
ncbi:MAG: dihydroorotase [Candidatus Eremiobacteraeota bacterium]|nr:dihydroorotase [Candidatus Eremiobacteraeota bacterium]